MINDKNLKQEGAEGSTNLQGQVITIHQGLSYSDVKEIAIDIFKSNFLELSENAANTARERVDELVEKFLGELQNRNPEAVQNMENPAMQYALFTAQKEYAKSGDKDLADVLVDILVDRAAVTEKNLKQIVLDESLDVVSKLTNNQMDTLSIGFLLKYSKNNTLDNLEKLDNYLVTYLRPFVNDLSKENSLFQHLEYCGCASISIGSSQIETLFRNNYKGLFSKGFTLEEYSTKIGADELYKKYITPCLHDKEKHQIAFLDDVVLEETLKKDNIPVDIITKFKSYFNQTTLQPNEIKEYLKSRGDFMSTLFDVWDNSSLKAITMTSVGIALAQANFRRKTGITLDLSIWIK